MRNPIRETIVFKDESYAIQGAIFDVDREMGCGFLRARLAGVFGKRVPATFISLPLSTSSFRVFRVARGPKRKALAEHRAVAAVLPLTKKTIRRE